jgi:peptidoglycan/xylan/chitin deacetylase (PgdA/CDA1 family)
LSKDRGAQEITKTEKILGDYMTHRYFRPPYGDYNRQTLEIAYKLGYRTILWDVDTRDWMATSSEEIVRRVIQRTKAGSIILFHEGKELTLEALPEILEWLIEEGYTFVTIAELLGD